MTAETVAETVPPSLGAQLREAREAAGLTVEDVAERTRVPRRHLTAIETDAHDSLPALPYATGFVKAFARTVGVDPLLASEQFRRETSKAVHVPATTVMLEPIEPRQLPSRRLLAVTSAALLAIIIAGLAWSGLFRRAPDAVPAVTQAATASLSQPVPVPVAALAPVTVAPGTAPVTAAQPSPATASPSLAASAAAPAGGAVTLTATDDLWIGVYDVATRKAVFTGTLTKGQRYTVPPGELKLRTGRAGALAVTVNGRAIPPLGKPAQTVSVSLSPASLLARVPGPA